MEQMLPNARVGIEYDQECAATFKDQDLAPGLELSNGRVVGVPTQAGDFLFVDINTSTTYSLTIIQDPRLLWKEIEPKDTAYAKPHRVHSIEDTEDSVIFGVSIRGRQHAHKGFYREDDYAAANNQNTIALCVADGLGSAAYSRLGSAIVTDLVTGLLNEWEPPEYFGDDRVTAESVISFVNKIEQAMLKNLAAENVDIAHAKTTFSLCLIDQCDDNISHVSTYSSGDSVIALIGDDEVSLLSNVHSGEFAGATKYFGQFPLDINDVYTGYLTENSIGVVLMTDGISDSQFDSEYDLTQRGSWESLLSKLRVAVEHQRKDTDTNALSQLIDTYESSHHDDRTLVGIISQRWLQC